MANRLGSRKRLYAVRRAPDGSAFQKCDDCGVSLAVALADLHECGYNRKEVKRFRGICPDPTASGHNSLNAGGQPRSPFSFFMESLMKNCEDKNWFCLYRDGFEAWKNMSDQERKPYVSQAQRLNSAYFRSLTEEANSFCKVDDEADSAMVGKFDEETDQRDIQPL